MKLGQMGTGPSRAGMSSIITQAISRGDRGWASWTHPRAEQPTASPDLPGTLMVLEAGLEEDTFKPFLTPGLHPWIAKRLQKVSRSVSVPVFTPIDFSSNQQGEKHSQKTPDPIQVNIYIIMKKSLWISIDRLEKVLSFEDWFSAFWIQFRCLHLRSPSVKQS